MQLKGDFLTIRGKGSNTMSLKDSPNNRKKGGDSSPQDNTLWLISFGDLLTLVLSTFLLLISLKAYSIGPSNSSKVDEAPKVVQPHSSSTLRVVSERVWETNNKELLIDVISGLKKHLARDPVLVEIQPCLNQDEEWLPLHLYRLTRELRELNIESQINPMFIHCEAGMAVGFRGKI